MLITFEIRKIRSNGSIFIIPEVIIPLYKWLKSKILEKKKLGLRKNFSTKLKNKPKNLKNQKFFLKKFKYSNF